jgi:hypothetical protein
MKITPFTPPTVLARAARALGLIAAVLPAYAGGAVLITQTPTAGGVFDLTQFSDFVHFTGTASNTGGSVSAFMGPANIPLSGVIGGTAIDNFIFNFTNGGIFAGGEISAPDNAEATALVHGGGSPDPNRRIWFGAWGSTQFIGFDVTLPTTAGNLYVFGGGFTGVGGGASLNTLLLSTGEADSVGYGSPDAGHFGVKYDVAWSGATPGAILRVKFANAPIAGGGNSGLIGAALVAVPEPSTIVLALAAVAGLLFWRAARYDARSQRA